MTFTEAERKIIESLTSHYGPEEAGSLAWLGISHVCELERAKYLSIKNEEIQDKDAEALFRILEELKTGRPLQYILGETEFYGLKFKVNPSVLIPRPETEELVDWVLIELRNLNEGTEGLKIIDIGTGSGCIPVSIKKYFPKAEIYAMDISAKALNTAAENAELNQTDLNFIQDDILDPKNDQLLHTQFDVIISNPPYVTWSEKGQMMPNVLEHEPHTALFVPNDDPLIFYCAIADFAIQHLLERGLLFLEINENLGPQTLDLLKKMGFSNIELRQDIRGKDRIIRAVR